MKLEATDARVAERRRAMCTILNDKFFGKDEVGTVQFEIRLARLLWNAFQDPEQRQCQKAQKTVACAYVSVPLMT